MEKEILMPHDLILYCGKSIDLAPDGEEEKPWVLQEQPKEGAPTKLREGGREMWAAHGKSWSAAVGSWQVPGRNFSPHGPASGVKGKLGQLVATAHSEWWDLCVLSSLGDIW